MKNIELTCGSLHCLTATKSGQKDIEKVVDSYYATADTETKLTILSHDEVPLFFGVKGKLIGAAKLDKTEIDTKSLLDNLRATLVTYSLKGEDLVAIIGPCLTFSHTPVERKVIEQLLNDGFQASAKRTDGVDFLDLPLFVLLELRRLGVKIENIKIGDYDTFENPDLLYSGLRGESELNASTAYFD